jgi:hypothetical protein
MRDLRKASWPGREKREKEDSNPPTEASIKKAGEGLFNISLPCSRIPPLSFDLVPLLDALLYHQLPNGDYILRTSTLLWYENGTEVLCFGYGIRDSLIKWSTWVIILASIMGGILLFMVVGKATCYMQRRHQETAEFLERQPIVN